MSKTKRLPETRRQRNSPSHTRVEREEEAKQKVATTWRQRSAPSHVFVSARHSATSVDPPLFARVPNPGGGAGSLPSVFLRGPCGARATGNGISITLSRTPLFFRGPQCQDGNPQQCNERNVTRAKAVRVDCYIAHRPPRACRFAGTFRSLARRPAALPARPPARPSGDPLAVLPSTPHSSRGLRKGGGTPLRDPRVSAADTLAVNPLHNYSAGSPSGYSPSHISAKGRRPALASPRGPFWLGRDGA